MNDDYYQRACQAYERYCHANNFVPQCPSKSDSEVTLTRVILSNVRGHLATYDITPSGGLRRVVVTPVGQRRLLTTASPRRIKSGADRPNSSTQFQKEKSP